MNHAPCVMTNTDQFLIRVCGCGVVHLSFGPAIINVTAEAMIAITETMKDVAATLRQQLAGEDAVNADEVSIDASGNVIFGRFPGHG